MKKINIPIFAIDFEGSRKIGVVEFGAAEIFNGEIVSLSTSICAPKMPIPPRDAEFFGIDNKTANAMPPFSERVGAFAQMRRAGIFASHNASVEDSLLRDTMPTPAFVPNFVDGGTSADWSPWLDTCSLVRNLYPALPSAKLSDAIDALGLQSELDALSKKFCPTRRRVWHCASYDALASALIIIHICRQDGFENVTAQWLLKYGGNPDVAQERLFWQ